MIESAHAAPRHVNRRLTARRVCQLQASYRAEKTWHPATAMDVSRNGCRLRLGEELRRGLRVTARFSLPAPSDGASPLSAEVQGDVIWSRLEGLSLQAGIHFPDDSPALLELLATLGE